MNKFDLSYLNTDIKYLAGTDEAGRGPLAGPVVAAAVVFNDSKRIRGVKDSKQLTEDEREKLYLKIIERAAAYSVCSVSHGLINRINILQASLLAMQTSIKRLKITPDIILVDGNKTFFSNIQCIPVIDGDDKSYSIAAASIIAKVTRDSIMKRLSLKFPQYLWDKNKGYATQEHIQAIREYGPCSLHRTLFLRKILYGEEIPQLNLEFELPED